MTKLLNARILIALAIIIVVGAMTARATGAFFTDTETSTGNTFTAGDLDLTVDSTAHYAGLVCSNIDNGPFTWHQDGNQTVTRPDLLGTACNESWAQTSLGPTNQFFNYSDVKPGDPGENTISLHTTNDAWMCADLAVTSNTDGDSDGAALADGIEFATWVDNASTSGAVAGDNIHQAGEPITFGPAALGTSGITLPLSDSAHGPAFSSTGTNYIGIAWCAGTMTVNGDGSFSCDGSTMGNEAQGDSMTADVTLRAVQSRNNPSFVCTAPSERPTVGALLSAYVAPTGGACNVTATTTIQNAINTAVAGDTVCVPAGTYLEDVTVNKDITLAGAGAASTNIVGQTSGEAGALVITSDGATVEGFNITDATGGVAALRISGARSGITVNSNTLNAVTGGQAFLTDGGQSNHTISNNVINGVAGQPAAYVNGNVSVSQPSTNVDFTGNTFAGAATELLGTEANGSSITLNKFTGTASFTTLESWEGNNLVNQNNFDVDAVTGPIHVTNSSNGSTQFPGTLNAQNNWWGDASPADNTAGAVDATLPAASAFPEN